MKDREIFGDDVGPLPPRWRGAHPSRRAARVEPSGSLPRWRSGFSLIEVLVATTLLLIITVTISMVFQQAGSAWSAGTGRADAEMALRAVLGSVERDLLNAVDARDYHGQVNPKNGSYLEFIAMEHLYDHRTPSASGGAAGIVIYTFAGGNVKREFEPLQGNVAKYRSEGVIINGFPLSEFKFNCIRPSPDLDPQGLPLRVEVTATASHSASFFTISGRSAGPNKKMESWDAKRSDDIRIGGKL